MPSSPTPPPPAQRNLLNMLRFALEFTQQPTHDEKELRARTVQGLVFARDALKPVFGEEGNLVQRLQRTLVATSKSLPCEDDPQILIQAVTRLVKELEVANGSQPFVEMSLPSPHPKTKSVFIIHGHDETNWLKLDRMLRTEFHLEPIVILARAGMSQPTIQKFENEASKCAYAFAMFTPDDRVSNLQAGQCDQARPNVIFETGWFIGRFGKERVLLLVKHGTQLHSDFAGMNRVEFQDDITHKGLEIKRELAAAQVIPS